VRYCLILAFSILIAVLSRCALNPGMQSYYGEPVEQSANIETAPVDSLPTQSTPAAGATLIQLQGVSEQTFEKFKKEVQRYYGTPYVWGGASTAGMDCSGLVASIYREAFHKKLPHSSSALFKQGYRIPSEKLAFGDLVFFAEGRSLKPSHVGIYITAGIFLHATVSEGVTLSKLYENPWNRWYVGARRVLD
jgi:probable lipoprotein NlpC